MLLKNSIITWIKANRVILANAGSLIGTTVLTSGLGFIYWWLAARQFPEEAVGLASAAVSAMSLLATIGMLGLGTLLIGELPRQPENRGALIITSLLVAGLAGLGLGFLFAIIAPLLSAELNPLAADGLNIVLFGLGVGFSAMTLVLDQALIGLLRGDLQLWRNGLFALTKLVALWLAAVLLQDKLGLTIYATWTLGNLLSLLGLGAFTLWRFRQRNFALPRLGLLRGLGRAALGHHILNLALLLPSLILPLLVTILLSASTNAYFYVAWMVANLVFVIPASLTTVLYAVGSADPARLAQKTRLTLKLALGIGLLANIMLFGLGGFLLSFFGSNYSAQAENVLHLLCLGVFAITIKDHFVAIYRIHHRIGLAAGPVIAGSLFEVLLAGLGALVGGLSGLALGWLIAMLVEAALMGTVVYRTAFVAAIAPPVRPVTSSVEN